MSEVILQRIQDSSIQSFNSAKDLEFIISPPIILGRGAVLKCADKKISRKHATIDWDEDGIVLTSTHINPTFVIKNGKETTLTQNNFAILHNGDKFGLLKDSFWYKLIIKKPSETNAEEEKDGSSKVEEHDKDSVAKQITHSDGLQGEKEEEDFNSLNNKENKIIKQTLDKVDEGDTKKKVDNIELETGLSTPKASSYSCDRERSLPNWLKGIPTKKDEDASNDNACQKGNTKPHGRIHKGSPTKQKRNPKLDLPNSCDTEETNKSEPPKKKNPIKRSPKKKKPSKASNYHKVSQDSDVSDLDMDELEDNKLHSISDKDEQPSPIKRNNISTSSNDDDVKSDMASPNKSKDEASPSKSKENTSPNKSKEEASPKKMNVAGVQPKESKNNPRSSCEFGEQCYRKNPNHRKTMAHPGDDDYANESEDDSNDERPECEFGLTCYRKNPQHRKTHKHTRKPQPQRQAKKKGKRTRDDGDSDSENDYDFDDPFLNDDSSDDYAPTDTSGSDTDIGDVVAEDTTRMLKEGNKFVKKRRK